MTVRLLVRFPLVKADLRSFIAHGALERSQRRVCQLLLWKGGMGKIFYVSGLLSPTHVNGGC